MRRKNMNRNLTGSTGIAITDFQNDQTNIGGKTALGKILVGKKSYRAYQDLSDNTAIIRQGDEIMVKEINNVTACVTLIKNSLSSAILTLPMPKGRGFLLPATT